ncbi:MAG: flavodoxin family protein [Synergistaceae bacterium]|nr:flavodoxin family protein [Synergistaceae bacterium]
MKIYIFDGGPRENWNTAAMCASFARGAGESGAETETVRLYDIDYTGCKSCFACKVKGGASFGRCGWRDGIYELLDLAAHADGVVFASPIYFGTITARLQAFSERLFFPFVQYDREYSVTAPKKLETAVIYTMNVKEPMMEKLYLGESGEGPLSNFERVVERVFTKPERICAFNTYQFSDYSRYEASGWDEREKAAWKRDVFPAELNGAFDAGRRMAEKIRRNCAK